MGHNSGIETLDCQVDRLSKLSAKQREVLDLVLQHKSAKEIAWALQISQYTVDQRIAAARRKLGVSTRGELARAYSELIGICGDSVYGISYVASADVSQQSPPRDQPADPVLMLSDATSISMELPWHLQPEKPSGLEALDSRFGIVGRLVAIAGLAVLIALLALAMAAMAMILPQIF